jgi:hypothetical protein
MAADLLPGLNRAVAIVQAEIERAEALLNIEDSGGAVFDRDQTEAGLCALRTVLEAIKREASDGVPAVDDRQQFEAAMGEALKTDQGAYALSRAHLPDQPYTFLATKWAWSAWQRALGVAPTTPQQEK